MTSLISSGLYSSFYLISFDIGATVLRFTSLPYDATISGVAYSSDNSVVAIDPPKLSNTADREAFKISLADPEFSYAALCNKMINSPVTIRGGFFNTSGAPLLTSGGVPVEVNDPILDLDDTLIMYSGYIDSVSYNIGESEGVLLTIECASPMASLDALSVFYTSQNSLKQRVPAEIWAVNPDTAFDNVSLGGKTQEIAWGKI